MIDPPEKFSVSVNLEEIDYEATCNKLTHICIHTANGANEIYQDAASRYLDLYGS